MSNCAYFKMHNGYLEKYTGQESEVVIPEGITTIGFGAFYNRQSIRVLSIPESIESIDLLAFHGCINLESVEFRGEKKQLLGKDVFGAGTAGKLPKGLISQIETLIPYMKTEALKQYVLKEDVWKQIPLTIRANIVLTRQSKALSAAYTFDPEEMAPLVIEMSKVVNETADEKQASVLAAFVLDYIDDLSFESIKEAYSVLFSHKFKVIKKVVLDERFQNKWLSLASGESKEEKPVSPIEKLVKDNWKITEQTKKLRQILKGEVKYRDSEEIAPADVVIFVINEYASQLVMPRMVSLYKTGYVKCQVSDLADQVANSLDMESFRQLLETLAYDEKNYKDGFILALGRYGSGKQISHMTAQMKEWETWWKYKATGRANIMIARGALFLSDTREAMLALDKAGILGEYAKMRNTNEEVIRDTALSEFGFESDGKKVYDLGGNKVYASIGKNLSVELFDENAGKYVKSIPKKNADESKYEAAKTDLADLKKNIKRVITNRRDQLFDAFLSGRVYTADDWKKAYIDNPVLRAIAELLVWAQEDNTFILNGTDVIDVYNNPFNISDSKPIKVAHPMEIPVEVIEGWQKYFRDNKLKQPFEQIWEPVADLKNISEDRYAGAKLSVYKFANMEKHGIFSYGLQDYSENFGFNLYDCKLEAEPSVDRFVHGVTGDATYSLGKFTVTNETRWANHIVYLLDKWTMTERILKDDISIGEILPSFTLSQILDFISLAAENKSSNSLAVLMDYKNNHYNAIDPLDKLILD